MPQTVSANTVRPLFARLIGVSLYIPLLLAIVCAAPLVELARLFYRPKPNDPGGRCWQNAGENQFARATDVVAPKDVATIIEWVRRAARSTPARRVRAIGASHSFSPVAVTDDIRLVMTHLRSVRRLRPDEYAANWQEHTLVYVEAGATIGQINAALDLMGLALANMGSYDVQTISGAISTATHGSGIQLGALCDSVAAIDLVTARADRIGLTRIEAANGPTTLCPPDVELVQNDDAFHSAVVGLGAFGVVVGYVLVVRKSFKLKETRTLRLWSEVKRDLEHRIFDAPDLRHYEVYINPYPRFCKGDRVCLVTERRETTAPDKNKTDRQRNPVTSFLLGSPASRSAASWLATRFPRWVPPLLDAGLAGYVDKAFIARSFEVLHLGDVNKVQAYSCEPSLAISADGKHPYLDAVDVIFETAAEQALRGRRFTSPMSLRFVKASSHFLAPMYHRDTCTIELPMLFDTPGGWDTLRLVEQRLHRLGSRPHWGQAHWYLGPDRLDALYPRWRTWIAWCRHFNPLGIFDSLVTETMGLRTTHAPKVD